MRRPPASANIAPVVHELIIVGAAPEGISTAVGARQAGIGRERILILEKGPAHSYAIRKFYPEDKRVDAVYKGIPAISEWRITIVDGTKKQTLDFLDQTIQRWELNVHYDEGAETIRKHDDPGLPRLPDARRTAAGLNETYALLLAYDGAGFRGWQKQPGMATVQGALEEAIRALLGKRYAVHGASRTDAGVHALGQVASLRSGRQARLDGLQLPAGLRLLRWAKAAPSFHARSSSIAKRYRYDLASFLPAAADWDRARAALRGLDGLPHLSGLCSPAKEHRPAPPLTRWTLDDGGVLELSAKAFRKHEVRNLAGHLGAVALGLAPPSSLRELALRRRPWTGARAPGSGLTLVEVVYPPELDPFR